MVEVNASTFFYLFRKKGTILAVDMKKILVILACIASISLANAHELGFDIGWNQSIKHSGGITIGFEYTHNHAIVGFDVCSDITGRMPNAQNPTRSQVDLSGHARLGYQFNCGVGFGALIGGYRMAVEYLGEYYYDEVYRYGYYYPTYTYYAPYYHETFVVKRRKGVSYAYMNGFDGGLFVSYKFALSPMSCMYVLGMVTCRTKLESFIDGLCAGLTLGFSFNVEQ